MRIIAVINQKGGCGKTTTSVNLAAGFADRRFRTLLIDADPQSHCALALGVPESRITKDLSDALRARPTSPLDAEELVWRIRRGLDLLPSRTRLAGIEAARSELNQAEDREQRLKSVIRRLAGLPALEPVRDPEVDESAHNTVNISASRASAQAFPAEDSKYDVVLIDCPPSIGVLTFNALAAANEVLIPVETGYLSLRGASKQVATIRSIGRRLGTRPKARVLPTMHHPDAPTAKGVLSELRETFQAAVIPVVVRYDQALRDAAYRGLPVATHAPDSPGAQDYASLCEWLIEHAEIDRASAEQMNRFEGLSHWHDDPRGLGEDLHADDEPEISMPTSPGKREASGTPLPAAAPDPAASIEAKPSRVEDLARRAMAMRHPPQPSAPPAEPRPESSAPTPSNAESPVAPTASGSVFTPTQLALPATAMSTTTAHAPTRPSPIEVLPREEAPSLPTPSETLRRLFGVRPTSRGALFVQPAGSAQRMQVAGTFNNWTPERHPMRLNRELGVFELQIDLPCQAHEYRLVIDGVWDADRYNPSNRPNGHGDIHSVIDLTPSP